MIQALIPIDDAPLRAEHAASTHRLLVRFSSARRQIAEYLTRDKPSFGRWLSTEFRELLAEAESLQSRLAFSRSMSERVESVRDRDRSSYRKAYRTALEEDQAGLREDAEQAEFDLDQDEFEDDHGEPHECDELNEREDEGRTFNAAGIDWSQFVDGADERPRARPISPEESARDRYRKLVRLLHPDLRHAQRASDEAPAVGAANDRLANDLWHQTQAAFKDRDLDQLAALLSIARLRFGDRKESPFLGEVLTAAAWLREALAKIGAEIRMAKRDDAWEFSKLKDRSRLRRKIEYQIEDDIADMRDQVARYESFLKKCATPPERARRPSARGASSATPKG